VALTPGTRLGPYDVIAQIGAGGMGDVYRARDPKLDRQVALKVLPAAVAQDADRLARFEREAKTLALLNHPNIGAIYGLEDSTPTKALVMELVEGPTLADRIAQGAIPFDDALPIVKQVADALEAAHEQGIIHRDIKPANIKIRLDGTVKVLDFGLAKALEPAGAAAAAGVSQFATMTSPAMTQAGIILGTAAYMSPEQARGRPVDKRTDIWAVGCLLYEMLSGARPFEGETITDVLGAVLRAEPDWSRIPAETPAAITTLMRRCLRKDARQRLADAGSVRLEVEDAIATFAHGGGAATQPGAPFSRSTSRRVPLATAVAVAVILAVAAATAGFWWRGRTPQPAAVPFARLAVPLPSGATLSPGPSVALSPDGTTLAFVAERDGISELYLRRLADTDARVVKDTRNAAGPFFSPDSESVAFFAGRTLKRLSTKTGIVTTIADALLPVGDWAPDGRIVSIQVGTGLRENATATIAVIPAGGGATRTVPLKSATEFTVVRHVSWLPGGKAVLVAGAFTSSAAGDTNVMSVSLDTGESRTLVERGSTPRYLPSGHLVFVQDGALKAVAFNPESLDIAGTPIEVLQSVRQQTFTLTAGFSCSAAGSCAYIGGGTTRSRMLISVDRSGAARPLGFPRNSYAHPRFSPSGDRLAVWIEQRDCELETYDLARGTVVHLKPITDSHYPTWTPNGRDLSFVGRRDLGSYSVYAVAADGSASAKPLLPASTSLTANTSLSWSPRGALVFADRGDLWVLEAGETEPRVIEKTPGSETTPAVSPDGQWIAYASDNGGRVDVHVRPFSNAGERFVISNSGGTQPVWARNGRELFFKNGDRFMVVDVTTTPTFTASRPRLMFTMRTQNSGVGRTDYDVSPDGQTFVMTDSGEDDRATEQVMLLQNWFGELTRLVPGAAVASN
jgi:eukaryotic-like serine/threonine-protein kinase